MFNLKVNNSYLLLNLKNIHVELTELSHERFLYPPILIYNKYSCLIVSFKLKVQFNSYLFKHPTFSVIFSNLKAKQLPLLIGI